MKNHKNNLVILSTVIIFTSSIFGCIFSLVQVGDLKKENRTLLDVVGKNEKLGNLLLQENLLCKTKVFGKRVKQSRSNVIKPAAIEYKEEKKPVKTEGISSGNRGFLVKDKKPTALKQITGRINNQE
ncbi:MAG: hypothetical protein V2A64_05065 [Candidatus Omnitrophota bacterium]